MKEMCSILTPSRQTLRLELQSVSSFGLWTGSGHVELVPLSDVKDDSGENARNLFGMAPGILRCRA